MLERQISNTRAIILKRGPSGHISKSQMRAYESLLAPPWMTLFGSSTLQTWDESGGPKSWDNGQLTSGFDDNMRMYTKQKSPNLGEEFLSADMERQITGLTMDYKSLDSHLYSSYPEYKDRLRILRAYMDSRRPKGFRGLWRDKRDT
ncbi:MAG: hypothetical protein FRX48_02080 [Lasallia pustulata]|uniref:Uncharacterized protein n=1 Tax=Lasallia pustulata TaxID=136370 RepID=A0A5M8PX96_9LECA|nr:MAG: hypothetical protein FRX48_02080 [Lasallia pustulata]